MQTNKVIADKSLSGKNLVNKNTNNKIGFNNIIIWRHAEAHPAEVSIGTDDMARSLTPKGKQQAKRMADWLDKRLPNDLLLVTSPALRAYQTAQALKSGIRVDEALKPSANLQEVLNALYKLNDLQPSSKNILLVGHQPWLWQLVAHLTGFSVVDINIKKGAVWWLRQSSERSFVDYNVIAVQSPSLLI
jgi:phosphohistidine phosphatase